jgi:peptide/nickel transport system ATP-binding protein
MMITHDLGVARLMSDRIHVMQAGRFVESGDAEQIVDHPHELYTQRLLAAIPDLGPWEDPALDNPELAAAAAQAAAVQNHQPAEAAT